MATNETEVNYLEGALQQLLQERVELDTAIAALQRRVGKTGTSGSPTLPAPSGGMPQPAGDVVVYRGEFFNLSVTKAAEKLLKRVGHPLKTPEILAAFERARFEIKSKFPRPTIYTSLNRSRDFVKVLPDTWDLAERHPEAAAKKEQEMALAKASKGNKKRRTAKAEKVSKPTTEGLRTVA